MKHLVLFACAASLLGLFSGQLSAQEKPKVEVKNPKSREGDKLKDQRLETRVRGEKEIFCVEDGVIPLKQPDTKESSGFPTLNFGDTFNFVDTEQVNGSVFYLLTRGDPKDKDTNFHYIGWVNGDSLLLSSECMRDAATFIQKKALLIVKNKPGTSELTGASVWTNSSGHGTSRAPISFYSIMFCYKKRNGYSLLGFQGKFMPALPKDSPEREDFWATMVGWVSDDAIEEWNTREALLWDSDSTLEKHGTKRRIPDGQIFNFRNDAIRSLSNKVVPGHVELMDEKNQSPPWDKNKMRYPILPLTTEGLTDTVDPIRGRLLRIGVIGDFINSKGEVVNRDELDLFRKKLDAIGNDLKYTEILVVIDATSSMDMWLNKAVPQWIDKIVKQSQLKKTQRVRIAACLYRDIDDQAKRKSAASLDEAVTFIPWEDIKEKGSCDLVQRLKEEKAKDGGDPCEQMIHGLKFGLTEASKDIKAHSRKLVVLIGDMGNHVSNNGPQNLNQDIQQISKLMVPENGTPWEMLAIQVPNSNAGAQADYQLFRDQSEKICEAVRTQIDLQNKDLAKEKSIQIKTNKDDTILEVVNRETFDSVLAALETQYAANQKKWELLGREALEFARGTRGGAGITPALEKIMAQENIDYGKLSQSGLQVFREGWVWEKNQSQQRQIQIQVLLTNVELQELNNTILAPILEACRAAGDPQQNLNEKMADKLVSIQAGEKISKHPMSYKNIMAKHTGLILNSKLFDITFGINDKGDFSAIDDGAKKRLDRTSELFMVYKKSLLLKDAEEKFQKNYVEEKIKNNAGNIIKFWKPVGKSNKTDRFFKQPGGSTIKEFIWIDGETEFP